MQLIKSVYLVTVVLHLNLSARRVIAPVSGAVIDGLAPGRNL